MLLSRITEDVVFYQAKCLLQLIDKNQPSADLLSIEKAIVFSYQAHQGQLRSSGDPYITHPISVATILAEQKFDTVSIITALLHDTVEDTSVSCDDIAREFSDEIAKLVDGVTKLKKIDYQPIYVRQAENFRKLLLAMSQDIRILLVKLADRVHNMRTIESIKGREKHLRIAHETMEIYAPLADRMGMHQFKNELEDLSFAIISPEIRKTVCNRLSFLTTKDQSMIKMSKIKLSEIMEKNGLKVDVIGRQKTPYSIWRKMEKKKMTFDQLSDIIAFRILVESVPDCYKALGILHTSYKVMFNGFKDYISLPKSNGYKSLHTKLIGEKQQLIEVQIRTYDMDKSVQFGMAAHWAYKSGLSVFETDSVQFKWINELIDVLKHSSNPEEILENARLDLYHDQVFCFTVDGELISLPKGSTPIDFAFCMHSDIGLKCVGATINGRVVNLNQSLQNGDQVTIITNPNAIPSPSWENFVVTGKARSIIRKFIRNTQQAELVNLGRVILIKALQKTKNHYNELNLVPLLSIFQKKTVDDLLFAIGRGLITRAEVLEVLFSKHNQQDAGKRSILRLYKKKSLQTEPLSMMGLLPGSNTVIAHCCSPLPGDRIVGIVHPSQGVIVHAIGCNILNSYTEYPEKWLNLSWDSHNSQGLCIGKVVLSLSNEPGALLQVSQHIKDANCNIVNIKIISKNAEIFQLVLDLEVRNLTQINNTILSLKKCAAVYSVERFLNRK